MTSPDGATIRLEPTDAGENFLRFVTYGAIEVVAAGELRFDSDRETEIFLTEPLSSSEPFERFVAWVLASVVAGGLGVVLLAMGLRRPPSGPGDQPGPAS
ncbi:MAG: hypothetical protein AAGA93_15140 [Actinomycetota bacterium]